MKITIPSLEEKEAIPRKYSCDGMGVNPLLRIVGVLEKAKTLVLIMDDPDAPGGTFDHWLLWNIPGDTEQIEENSIPKRAVLGKNSAGDLNYVPPCPPTGTHRYYFRLYALDTELDIPQGSTREELEEAMEGHVLEEADFIRKYKRA